MDNSALFALALVLASLLVHRRQHWRCRTPVTGAGFCSALAVLLTTSPRGMVWAAYVLPLPVVWDLVHDRDNSDGGVWQFGAVVHPEIACFVETQIRNYSSLVDVSCNAGHALARMQRANPSRDYFGTDISERIIREARTRCREPRGGALLRGARVRR